MLVQITNLEEKVLEEVPLISPQLAEFAISALIFPQHERWHLRSARKAEKNEKISPPPLKKRKVVSSSSVPPQITRASSVGQVAEIEKKPLRVDEHTSQGRNRERHKTNIPARLSDFHLNLIPLPSPPVVSVETQVVTQSSVSAGQVPLSKPAVGVICKITNLTRDEQFQQEKQTLMDKEKIRSLDDVIDLSVQPKKTLQLVSWRRFHYNFHSGKVLIRYFKLNRHLIISVIKPTDKVATKNTLSIQNLKNDPRAPDTIKELLDPYPSFTSSEQKSRYSLLRFDGVTWKWIGCPNLEPVTVLPSTSRTPSPMQPEVTTPKSFTASTSSNQKKKPKDPVPQSMPKKHPLSERDRTKKSTSLVVEKKPPSPAVLEATTADEPTRAVIHQTRLQVRLLGETNRSGRALPIPKERKKPLIKTQHSSTSSSRSLLKRKRGAQAAQEAALVALSRRKTRSTKETVHPLGSTSPVAHKVMFAGTGIADNDNLHKIVNKLGGLISTKETECSVLVTDGIQRTEKFLHAVILGLPIVSPKWLEESGKKNKFLDPWDHLWRDPIAEEELVLSLSEKLNEAWQQRMVGDDVLTSSDCVVPRADIIMAELEIIRNCGGQCYPRQKVYACQEPDCRYWAKLVDDFHDHIVMAHRDEHPFKCSACTFAADNCLDVYLHQKALREAGDLLHSSVIILTVHPVPDDRYITMMRLLGVPANVNKGFLTLNALRSDFLEILPDQSSFCGPNEEAGSQLSIAKASQTVSTALQKRLISYKTILWTPKAGLINEPYHEPVSCPVGVQMSQVFNPIETAGQINLEEKDASLERTQLRQLQIKDQRDIESKKESSLQLANLDGQTNEAKGVKLEKLLKNKRRIVGQQRARQLELVKRRGPLTRQM